MHFVYVAYGPDRKLVRGALDLPSEAIAQEHLSRAGLRVLSIRERRIRARTSFRDSLAVIGAKDVIQFSRELATLLSSGVTLLDSLQMLGNKTTNPLMKEVLSGVRLDVLAGRSFSAAVSRQPKAFSKMYVHLMRTSEKTGNLDQMLNQVADHIERQWTVFNKIRQAMVYPSIVVLLAIGSIAILTTVTLPALVELFLQFDQQLPLPTRIMMAIVSGIAHYRLHMLAGILLLAGITFYGLRQPDGRKFRDSLSLGAPIVGKIISLSQLSQLAQNMAVLIQAGLSIPEVLALAAETSGNVRFRNELSLLGRRVAQGARMSDSMAGSKLYPPLFVQMVAVGEETGTLDSKLLTVASMYRREVDQRISLVITLIEPAMLVAIGLVVAFIGLSIIMPLYSIMSAIQ